MIEKYKGNKDFLKMSNATIRDTSLSLEARGLLAVILSFPENYNITNAELVELSGLSKRTINRLLLELESSGRYFSTKKVGGAKRVEWDRTFYDLPQIRSATSGAPYGAPKMSIRSAKNDNTERQKCKYGAPPVAHIKKHIVKDNVKDNIKDKRENPLFLILDSQIENDSLKQSFKDFIEMRKSIKAPLTPRALELAIKKAKELSNGNTDIMQRIVEQSTLNSWRGLFPLKEPYKATPISQSASDDSKIDEALRIALQRAEGGNV